MKRQFFLKRMNRQVRHFFAFISVYLLVFFIKFFPFWFIRYAGNIIGTVLHIFSVKHKNIIEQNLSLVSKASCLSPDKKVISKKVFISSSRIALENLWLSQKPVFVRRKIISLTGIEYVQSALSKGKGAIIVTGHFSNFALIPAFFSMEGFKVSVLVRPLRYNMLNSLYKRMCQKYGFNLIFTIPKRQCISDCIKALNLNQIVCILADQNVGKKGIITNFFQLQTYTMQTPFLISLRTGSAILPAFVSGHNGHYQIQVLPCFEILKVEDIKDVAQKFTSLLEERIRGGFHQWMWAYRRWNGG